VTAMVDENLALEFHLPVGFVSAFELAHGSDARMKVVDQFFHREEVSLSKDGTLELEPNDTHQVYLVGSSSLIHIERHEPEGTLYVIQPVQGKRGTIGKNALEDKIVSQMKTGRKLWLLTRKVAARSHVGTPPQATVQESEPLAQEGESCVSAVAMHPDQLVSDTSSAGIPAVSQDDTGEELNIQAFGQLRTMLQNVRLEFWSGQARSQPTETVSVAAQKAEQHDITGAIQSLEMLENVFVRLIEQWEQDFHAAERRVKRGGNDAGDPKRFKILKEHHQEMRSRIAQAKTKFRIMLNWLRETEKR
jgi:hypothetical protein